MDFEWQLFLDSLPSLIHGARTTIALATASAIFGLIIGVTLALLHATAFPPFVWFVTAWTTLMRSLPLLVTLLFLYYGLPSIGILLNAVTVAILAMSITTGGFVTEIMRAGIESIDRGQIRAAKSLGMSWAQSMRWVVLPQAFRRVLPPLTSEAITLLKNTALVSVIAIPDLLRAGTDIMTWKANTFSPFAGVALIYLCMTLPLVALNAYLGRGIKRSQR
ncbi:MULTISPECIES: amino acid ABC transporter permease [unclassified Beijerinckia]|uniref:amino acid ABC transporter permease n=1 Tax=unclassified Beijerinckia TaxID=2638183 RepID=UPI0008992714|nr:MULTISPECIES: amino acid ABC transporter permease [unclassified Beijerinckia]MDH7794029.1 His/Glu/Gln/Arg/opine family amino acid ABC transporter permease subunit [Beijerinckia sp. GAS462]SEB51772.1 amino acid ABC transporter membrane protein, PAAT family [Beijerinckia sp. 28-YEA-48]